MKKSAKVTSRQPNKGGRPKAAGTIERERLAKLYNTDPETVRAWHREGAPLGNKVQMEAWIRLRQNNGNIVQPVDIEQARLAKVNAETQRILFRLQIEKGEFTSNAEVQRQATACGERSRAEWMALINEIPTWAGLSPAEMQDKAKQLVNRVLARLHE